MTLSEYFALAHGNQAALVRALDAPQTTVAHWASRSRTVPAEYGIDIERATGGKVTRQDLLPDTWARIWPELAPAGDEQNFLGVPSIDHAAEQRDAIAQTRLVFEGHRDAQDALEYLEQVLKACQRAEVPAHACAPTPSDSRGVDVMLDTPVCKPAPARDNSALAQLKRELFTTADQLQQPADLVVQLLVLAELRGMRAEQASDRFAHGAAVLS